MFAKYKASYWELLSISTLYFSKIRLSSSIDIGFKKALSKLSDREKLIISLRFGLNNREEEAMTQKEVADLLGISQSYISRLEKKIMKRLKKEMV